LKSRYAAEITPRQIKLTIFQPGPSPGFSSRGPNFSNRVLDIYSHRGGKHEMGSTDFKWGSQAPLAPPLATALISTNENLAYVDQRVIL